MRQLLFVSTSICVLAGAPSAALAKMAIPSVDELVVTANRSPERIGRVGQQITVLDRADLEARQTPVLSDILAATPGVTFSRNGGVGEPTQLSIRGADTGQTVVLIDGVKLNDPSSPDSAYNFGNLLVGDVARVELLRGPQSVLWGSQAIGGVVNLITADPQKPLEADLTLEGGSHAWAYGRMGLGGKSQRVVWRANAAYLTTSGVSAFDEAKGGRERDGYHNAGASGKAQVQLTDRLSADLRAVYSRGRNAFDGLSPQTFTLADTGEYGIVEDLVGYAGLNFDAPEARLRNRVAYAYTHTNRKNLDPAGDGPEATFEAVGRNQRWEYQGSYRIGSGWTAVFGAETERSRMRSISFSSATPSPTPTRGRARLDSQYAQVRGEVAPGVTVNAGLRHDHHDAFGGQVVGQASAAWRLNDGATILRANWGEGFKAPSLYQLGSLYGNPDLKPETSESWDLGAEQRLWDGRVVLQAAYFERRTKQQIDFVICGAAGAEDQLCLTADGQSRFGYYANTARTKARGVEFAGHAQLDPALAVDVNYTWVDAQNDVAGSRNRGKRLRRRPAHTANAEATYRWADGLRTTAAARYAGGRFDDEANRRRLKSYVLWDLRAAYPLRAGLELYGRVDNLFDKRYETILNFGELGRTAYAGLRARF